ncbi:MAG: class I SAM-dependent methyltransferase [bacterium]
MDDPMEEQAFDAENGYRNEVCPACLSPQTRRHLEMDGYVIDRCGECGHAFVRDVPSDRELFLFYRGAYQEEGGFQPKLRWHRKLKYGVGAALIRLLFLGRGDVRLLDIGCSQGDLLEFFKGDEKFEAKGLDLAEGPVAWARSQGLDVSQGDLEGMEYSEGRFDMVVAAHTVEHMQDPARTLAEVHRVLAPGGCFFAVCPCLSHVKARLAGEEWKYWGPPGHLNYFTSTSFRRLLSRLGFRVLFSSCLGNQAHVRVLARKI